jgi:predicted phage terminase large subunit-like protein
MNSATLESPNYSAKQELLELLEARHVQQCRNSLLAFCTEVLTAFGQTPARHHRKIIERLEALSRGEIERLMILAPPGSAKSTYVSQLFPAWFLAQHPGSAVIAASHTGELAERFGRRVRNLITEHSGLLGYGLSADNAAAGRWETTDRSEYLAAGVSGAIAGRRADLVVIDDPIKSRQDADSGTVSSRTWDWWVNDVVPRLKPGGRVVLVQTRWAEADLGGRLEDEMATGGERWEILRLPMLAEINDPLGRVPGEMLWDDWFTPEMLVQAQRDTRTWSALYQQRPLPEGGDYFKREWLRSVPTLPPRSALRVFGASDYAVTDNGGDYTVHIVVGVDSDDRLYVLDLWRQQASSDRWVEAFCDLVIQWHPMGWAEETGQIKAGIGPWLDRRSRERRAFVARDAFPTRGDKSVRAQSIRGRCALSGLYIAADASFRAILESELLSFPAGKHDDIPDALGLIGQLLDVLLPPAKPDAERPPEDTWDRAFRRARGEDDGENSWKVS